ncbi:MAG TPA: acylphosphatase [Gemmataceae bacterium]|nr:acylphosphatase [Gemmataceae bacterium]
MLVRKRVLYAGQVQGVGFRYTTRRLADGFAVAGCVRNLPSGEVELIAEGEPGEVQRFLEAVAGRMADSIDSHTIHDEPPAGLQGFVIRA